MQLPKTKPRRGHAAQFVAQLETRLIGLAGIEAAAVTTGVPPSDGGERLIEIDRTTGSVDEGPRFVSTVAISPSFFDVVDRPPLRGRDFEDADGLPGFETAIINERLAAQFFPGEDPIGRRLRFTTRNRPPSEPPEVARGGGYQSAGRTRLATGRVFERRRLRSLPTRRSRRPPC